MNESNMHPSHVYAYIIIGSDSVLDAYADYSSAAAYYHSLIQRHVISDNIFCLCRSKYFDGFRDNGWVTFQTDRKETKQYRSIKEKFQVLNFENFPKVHDPDGVAYVILFNYGLKYGIEKSDQFTYWQFFLTISTSLKVSQLIFVDSSCYSGLIIDTYNKLVNAISKLKSFPKEIRDQLTVLFFSLMTLDNDLIAEIRQVIGHLKYTDLAFLNKQHLSVLVRIADKFLPTQFKSYTYFLENIENIPLGQAYSTFSEFKADALFVSKTRIEYRSEFFLIKHMISIFTLDDTLEIFNHILQPEYFSIFCSFIQCLPYTNNNIAIHISFNLSKIKFQNFLTPITVFTASSNDKSTFYPSVPITINGSSYKLPLSSPFRSTILNILFANPLNNIDDTTVQPYFNSIHDENGDTPQFFTSCSKPFSILNIQETNKRRRNHSSDIFNFDANQNPIHLSQQKQDDPSDKNISDDSDYLYSSDSSSSEMDINYVGKVEKVIPVPEELIKIEPDDKIFYPYETDKNKLEIPISDYRAGQFFKQFYFKLNELLANNHLVPLRLYREEDIPKDFKGGTLKNWGAFIFSTSKYIDYVMIHQFDYYVFSFGYLIQINWMNLKSLLNTLVETLDYLRATSEYTEYYAKYKNNFVPFNIDKFMEKYLFFLHGENPKHPY